MSGALNLPVGRYFEISRSRLVVGVLVCLAIAIWGAYLVRTTTMEDVIESSLYPDFPAPVVGWASLAVGVPALAAIGIALATTPRTPLHLFQDGLQDLRISFAPIPWDQITAIKETNYGTRRHKVLVHEVNVTATQRQDMKLRFLASIKYRSKTTPFMVQTNFVKQNHTTLNKALTAFISAYGRPDTTLNLTSA